MWSDLVVAHAPVFDCDLRIDSVLEPLHPEPLDIVFPYAILGSELRVRHDCVCRA